MLNQLQRPYYWLQMAWTLGDMLADCDVFQTAKYDRTPQQVPQILTEQLDKQLQTVYKPLLNLVIEYN